jgi:hypothetical protein
MDHAPTYNRHARALLAKARACTVRYVNATTYDVHTPSDSRHIVRIRPPLGEALHHTCDCQWRYWHPDQACAHILAVELLLARQENVRLSVWSDRTSAQRQHRIMRRLDDLYITARRY